MARIWWCALVLAMIPAVLTGQTPRKPLQIPYSETTAGMVEQANKDFKEADRKLNAVYASLLSRLDEPTKKNLRDVQEAWIRYRDTQVVFEGSMYQGGSIRPLIEGNWRLTMTNNRTKELQLTLDSDFE